MELCLPELSANGFYEQNIAVAQQTSKQHVLGKMFQGGNGKQRCKEQELDIQDGLPIRRPLEWSSAIATMNHVCRREQGARCTEIYQLTKLANLICRIPVSPKALDILTPLGDRESVDISFPKRLACERHEFVRDGRRIRCIDNRSSAALSRISRPLSLFSLSGRPQTVCRRFKDRPSHPISVSVLYVARRR